MSTRSRRSAAAGQSHDASHYDDARIMHYAHLGAIRMTTRMINASSLKSCFCIRALLLLHRPNAQRPLGWVGLPLGWWFQNHPSARHMPAFIEFLKTRTLMASETLHAQSAETKQIESNKSEQKGDDVPHCLWTAFQTGNIQLICMTSSLNLNPNSKCLNNVEGSLWWTTLQNQAHDWSLHAHIRAIDIYRIAYTWVCDIIGVQLPFGSGVSVAQLKNCKGKWRRASPTNSRKLCGISSEPPLRHKVSYPPGLWVTISILSPCVWRFRRRSISKEKGALSTPPNPKP